MTGSTKEAAVSGHLLIVDDETAQMRALCHTLQAEGYTTTGFSSAKQALQGLTAGTYDLLLTDLMMPEMDGIDLLHAARQVDPDLVGVVMTGHATIDTAVKAMQVGALDYIQKPFRLNVILPVLGRALDLRRLRKENAALLARELQHLQELEHANRELRTANRDLESFSYTVSHDLRAPLRAIRGFTQLFMEQFGAGLDQEGRGLLGHVENGGERMDRLIEDLLRFSRSGRQPLTKSPVDLRELVLGVVQELRAAQPERTIEVNVGELPKCEVDAALVRQVFVNLLSNAFKFTRDAAQARVDVQQVEHNGKRVLCVSDNGAGFDMKFAGKLFGVFQRLHAASEFEGTGVGLSIVQRVIERHGGGIWAESAVGQGARFYFTLWPEPVPAL